jgi:uncharacterized protein involved in exopolysaccharide biosynthesis
MDIAKDNIARIRQLESVVTQLQTRIGQIAASYELEIAVLKAQSEELRRNVDPEETD